MVLLYESDKIFIDTSTLMEVDRLKGFLKHYSILLKQLKKQIIVIKSVVLELANHSTGDNAEKARSAGEALNIIRNNSDIFIEEIPNNYNKKAFADNSLLSRVLREGLNNRVLLITQDHELQNDTNAMREFESQNLTSIHVCKIDKFGHLEQKVKQQKTINIEPEKKPIISDHHEISDNSSESDIQNEYILVKSVISNAVSVSLGAGIMYMISFIKRKIRKG